MGLRDRRQERREGRRGDGGATYRMRQKLVSIGDDYWIEDEDGNRVFEVDGKALRVRQTLAFENREGCELYHIQEACCASGQHGDPGRRRCYRQEGVDHAGARALVRSTSPMAPTWRCRGIWSITSTASGRAEIAEVPKKWFRIANTYGVEVADGQDPVLMLAIAAVLDSMAHRGN